MIESLRPKKVSKIFCPKCGELMVKFYPWSSIQWEKGSTIPNCRKCLDKIEKKIVH